MPVSQASKTSPRPRVVIRSERKGNTEPGQRNWEDPTIPEVDTEANRTSKAESRPFVNAGSLDLIVYLELSHVRPRKSFGSIYIPRK